jgi:NodT family efflux transporter outer membrane factor (OMF) lipoprotein
MTRYPIILLLALGSCTVGPDFKRPDAPTDTGYTARPPASTASAKVPGGAAQSFADRDIPGAWWSLFHSEPLDRLVKQALAANPDIEAAQAALRQAEETRLAAFGSLFPTVTGGIQTERERTSGAAFGNPRSHQTLSLVTPNVTVSYGLDVWGGARRAIESLTAQAEYQRFEAEAAYLTLTSNVVAAAIQEASLRGQIAATREVIAGQEGSLGLVRQRFQLGSASQADVLSQEAQLAQTRVALPPLERQLAVTRDQLTALAGQLPSHEIGQSFDLDGLRLPEELPVSVPSRLIEQRPDVRAAEAQLHAASASIGVAAAAQLPQFAIGGSAGTTANTFANAFSLSNGVWTLTGGVTQTLFDAGALEHKKKAAIARFEEAAAQYRGAVIRACQNVADTLHALESDANALAAQSAAERSAFASLDLSRRQYALGAIDYQTLLNAQRTWQQARVTLVQARAARFTDTAALFQALGGGWWNRSDIAETKSSGGVPNQ